MNPVETDFGRAHPNHRPHPNHSSLQITLLKTDPVDAGRRRAELAALGSASLGATLSLPLNNALKAWALVVVGAVLGGIENSGRRQAVCP